MCICLGDIIVEEIRRFLQKKNGTLTPEYQLYSLHWRDSWAQRKNIMSGIIMESFRVICVGAGTAACVLPSHADGDLARRCSGNIPHWWMDPFPLTAVSCQGVRGSLLFRGCRRDPLPPSPGEGAAQLCLCLPCLRPDASSFLQLFALSSPLPSSFATFSLSIC